ncbi:DUF305 domain-containing protein [Geodermatophilus sp. SYSU D01176]
MTAARSPLRALLLAVIAVGLVLIGGGAAVALGIGRGEPAPAGDSVAAGFARDMSRHHLQGVEMANLALERSTDPEVRRLAFDIAETQQNQVGRMQGWLALWDLPPTGGETMAWMSSGSHAGHDTAAADGGPMPGMATEEELAQLRALSGTAFDVEFLRLMIRHHQGGYDMARYAAEHAGLPAVASLAGTIAETQTAEVTTMERMLTARGGAPLPAP